MIPIAIGQRKELFVDTHLINSFENTQLKLNTPQKEEVVFKREKNWENHEMGYFNLFRDEESGIIRMYYRCFNEMKRFKGDTDAAEGQYAAYAESTDGIHFERPKLGLVEFEGSRDNNMIWRGQEGHNFTVFVDKNPKCKEEQRYKAIGGGGRLRVFSSPDAIHWKPLFEEVLDTQGAHDTGNTCFWDEHMGCYRLFYKYKHHPYNNDIYFRAIRSCTSDDLLHWNTPVDNVYPDDTPIWHHYTNNVMLCPGAEHIYLSFPKRYNAFRTMNIEELGFVGDGISDAMFMSSRDGIHWDRSFKEAWVRPGLDRMNWTNRSNMPALGIIENTENEWSFYIAERNATPHKQLRRMSLPAHRLASVNAGYAEGSFLTKPITFSGHKLLINYSTSAVGGLKFEIQDVQGKAISGFELDNCEDIYGDEFQRQVTWKNKNCLTNLIGKSLRLKVVLKDADLYALQFSV